MEKGCHANGFRESPPREDERLETRPLRGDARLRARIDQRVALPHFELACAVNLHGMRKNLGFFVGRALRFDLRGERAVVVAIGDLVFRHGQLLLSPRSMRQFRDEALRVKRNFRHGFHELS